MTGSSFRSPTSVEAGRRRRPISAHGTVRTGTSNASSPSGSDEAGTTAKTTDRVRVSGGCAIAISASWVNSVGMSSVRARPAPPAPRTRSSSRS
jgi:hypothetical protein